jgi:hypothetical protein
VKLFVKLVMSLVGAAGGASLGFWAFGEYLDGVDAAIPMAAIVGVIGIGWFVGLYAGRLICHDPTAK